MTWESEVAEQGEQELAVTMRDDLSEPVDEHNALDVRILHDWSNPIGSDYREQNCRCPEECCQ